MNLVKGLAAFCCAVVWLFVLPISPPVQAETKSTHHVKKNVQTAWQFDFEQHVAYKKAVGRPADKPPPIAGRSEAKNAGPAADPVKPYKAFFKKTAATLPYNRQFRISADLGAEIPSATQAGRGAVVTAFEKVMVSGKVWYHVTYNKNKTVWISSAIVSEYLPASGAAEPLNVPLITQKPQLPRGCEVTSLAMMLKYAGRNVSKMTLARQIKKVPFRSNGYYGDPHDGFVGNMYTFSKPGFGVFHEPVAALARRYLGGRIVVDLSGKGFGKVQAQIKKKRPVWVIVTSRYRHLPERDWKTWRTKNGSVRITYHEHAVLITGCSNRYVYINDPLAGIKNRKINRKDFIAGFNQFGKQAISYN
ncbi:C39 family peptidase [Terrilactibacillus sp. S3-3]|nr:C39 family peptidase [Terrilactibacillus sp. S3-3]